MEFLLRLTSKCGGREFANHLQSSHIYALINHCLLLKEAPLCDCRPSLVGQRWLGFCDDEGHSLLVRRIIPWLKKVSEDTHVRWDDSVWHCRPSFCGIDSERCLCLMPISVFEVEKRHWSVCLLSLSSSPSILLTRPGECAGETNDWLIDWLIPSFINPFITWFRMPLRF